MIIIIIIIIIITKLSLAEQISKNVFTAQYKIEDRRRPQKVVSKRFKSPYWLNTSGLYLRALWLATPGLAR